MAHFRSSQTFYSILYSHLISLPLPPACVCVCLWAFVCVCSVCACVLTIKNGQRAVRELK